MGWWRRWLGQKTTPADEARSRWQRDWAAAAAQPGSEDVGVLKASLDGLSLPEDEIELEREMLEGLEAVLTLQHQVARAGLPIAETGHRVIGTEPCHFIALAFAPDEPDQPAGRLLFTPTRAVFAGGGRTTAVPWHSIGEVRQSDRDVLLIRVDREQLFRFRCNSYADAMCAAVLARRLAPRLGRNL